MLLEPSFKIWTSLSFIFMVGYTLGVMGRFTPRLSELIEPLLVYNGVVYFRTIDTVPLPPPVLIMHL
jgi:hypothetical protein